MYDNENMMKMKLELPDGSSKEFQKGITGFEVVKTIVPTLAHEALAIKVNNELKDLGAEIEANAKIKVITFKDKEGKELLRHSASHIMADAVTRLYPNAQLTIGMTVDDGFYYDIDVDSPFTPEDLNKIEKEMGKIVAENVDFIRLDVSLEEAKKKFKDNTYKLELINDLQDQICTIYQHGKFIDLCKGPHVPYSSKIKAFKLTKLAGVYWRGDAKNRQLQRIYGVAFPDKKELREYLELLKEADKRDHRKLGRELEIFSIHEEGPGFPFFLPKGIIIKNELVQYWREIHRKAGYVEIQTPIMLNRALWECSGHWANYRQNMYLTEIDREEYAIKPMNCPGGMLVYKEKVHSYKELPMRVGEIGIVHRHELSGVVTGLFRVRVFTQDDAHIFMTEEQIKDEIKGVMKLMEEVYGKFGFSYHIELSTRPEKSIGTDEQWDHATLGLKSALDESGFQYKINEGDGAFYGPKIDYHLKDCIGRTWQCGTIQLDMSLPERFALTYMDKDGRQDKRPVMIHRVVYGSIERFMGILIEHFAGKFPLWLSPVHARILNINDRSESYAKKIYQIYFDAGLRVEVDLRSESISKKVRDAQIEKIPLILTVGEKEEITQTIAVRTLEGQVKYNIDVMKLLSDLRENIRKRDIWIGFV